MASVNSTSAAGANSYSTRYSSNRLTGMFSNLDTDALVQAMTSGQQAKIDKVKQQQTKQGWLEETWSSVQKTINTFQNTYASVTGSSSMLKTATYYSYKVTSDVTTSAVSLSASSTTAAGSYTVQVDQLAQNASISSSNISAGGSGDISSGKTLAELNFGNALKFGSGGNISFSINGKAFTFSSDTTLQSMLNTINNDTTANVTMKYSQLTDGFTITSDSGGAGSSVLIRNISGNAFGTNSAFGIEEGIISADTAAFSSQGVSSGISTSSSLAGLSFSKALQFDDDGNISFSINDKTFTFSAVTKLQDMLDQINADPDAGVTMSYSSVTDGFTIQSTGGDPVKIINISGNAFGDDGAFGIAEGTTSGDVVSSSNISGIDTSANLSSLSFAKKLMSDANGNFSFAINGKTFTFAKTTTLQGMLDTINSDPDAKVHMSYDSATDGFTISPTSGGSVSIQNISGNLFGKNSAFGIPEGTRQGGTDAVVSINGVKVTRDSNEFTIDNVTYSLKAVTKGTANEKINFSVERDYSATTNAVKTMVDAFNTMITSLTTLLNEKNNSADYPPLTDAQKESMTTEQIDAWNEKAKSGLLRHNMQLESFISNLKNAFYSPLGGTGMNMTSIGITTASYFDSNAGQLVLDTDELEKALKNNPDQVVAMFTNGSSTSASSDQGLMYKLRSIMSNYDDTLDDTIETSQEKISSYESDLSDLQDKLDSLASRYYAKFSAMETALSKLNSQASYISQMFGSTSG
ncbi:Flagellar hook-associated protein 2 N-terminus [Sporobacter termitidis DSM 10068]|uniref:Flagellar hook-associated protein 2 n=1 Tax=Sporobacter termitidis DSM 10068 TaxID=1123282 RepID=A0A1M5W9D9_9FIRM|nr:flagellar filament capping protein FliD [Sporobacter termitidis]SHH84087.1 Flagellar hook-associated protein 2 N-terminus [Sporobacter termitidis DSM 10068]